MRTWAQDSSRHLVGFQLLDRVQEVYGEEKVDWWERAVEAWPDYANYLTKTDRQIPVFVLEPATSA